MERPLIRGPSRRTEVWGGRRDWHSDRRLKGLCLDEGLSWWVENELAVSPHVLGSWDVPPPPRIIILPKKLTDGKLQEVLFGDKDCEELGRAERMSQERGLVPSSRRGGSPLEGVGGAWAGWKCKA